MTGMAFVNGQLYGVGYNSGELYRIDTTTGATTDLGTINQYGAGSGGSDLVAGSNGSVYLFDGSQGNVFTLAPPATSVAMTNLPYFNEDASHSKFAAGPDGKIYSVYVNQFNPIPQQLLVMDPTTGQVTSGPVISPTNSVAFQSHLVFDGATLDLVSSNGLYTINTTTGAVTQDFAFSSDIGGVGSAASPFSAPEPATLGMMTLGGFALFGFLRLRRPRS
jgi:hypothetical protein